MATFETRNSFYRNFCILRWFCTLHFQVKIKLYMVAAVGGCVVLFSSLLLAALLLHLRRRQEHKYLRQVPSNYLRLSSKYLEQVLPPLLYRYFLRAFRMCCSSL